MWVPDGAVEYYGADDAFPIDDIDDILPGIMESCSSVYYTMGAYAEFDRRMADWVRSLRSRNARGTHTPDEFVALDHLLHDMRLYKSRAEISAMRKSAKIALVVRDVEEVADVFKENVFPPLDRTRRAPT